MLRRRSTVAIIDRQRRRCRLRWPIIKILSFYWLFDSRHHFHTIYHRRWSPRPPMAVQTQERYGEGYVEVDGGKGAEGLRGGGWR
ncbi:hypothetical protein PVK06_031877 [Gossypium arboreum]|uniref:Uncharacterized protein n=1 Tax=Gossypium arboreum TaxID=29729 RepID=A0ABR0NSC4_GOSAR|nr:hypothetical protein PVK06_031877 [Gossypium arboreum]